MRVKPTGNLSLPVYKGNSSARIKIPDFAHVRQATVDEMLDTGPSCNLIHADSPIELVLLANGKAVGVDKTEIDSFESRGKCCFIVAVTFDELDILEGAQLGSMSGVNGACEGVDIVFPCGREHFGDSAVLSTSTAKNEKCGFG